MANNKFTAPETLARCVPMGRLQSVLGGKWKILILWYVAAYGVQRFGELLRRLRELEQDGFLRRKVYEQVPLRVEYTLTPLGESFAPLLHAMLQWSQEHLEELGGAIETSKEQ